MEEMRRRGKERLVDASRRGEVVPIHQVFDRIRQETQVTAPASVVDEIDKAFKKLELAAATTSLERWSELPSPLSPLANTTPSELQLDFMTGHKNPLQVGSQAVAIQPGPGELVSGLASKAAPGGLSGASILAAQDGGTSPALPAMSSPSGRALLSTSPSLPALELPPSSPAPEHSPSLLQVAARSPPTPSPPPPRPTPNKLDALFTEVTPPLLTCPATPTPPMRPTSPLQVRRRLSLSRFGRKTRKTKESEFSLTNPRRSSRLAGKPAMPTMQKCSRVLMKRLGLLRTDTSLDEVLAEYVAMFDGPLPPQTVAALTSIFDLDIDDDGDQEQPPEEALLAVVGEGVADLADEVEEAAA